MFICKYIVTSILKLLKFLSRPIFLLIRKQKLHATKAPWNHTYLADSRLSLIYKLRERRKRTTFVTDLWNYFYNNNTQKKTFSFTELEFDIKSISFYLILSFRSAFFQLLWKFYCYVLLREQQKTLVARLSRSIVVLLWAHGSFTFIKLCYFTL